MPKNDVKITLNIGLEVGQEIEIKDYGQGEFFLDAGYYFIELHGATGGNGGRSGGDYKAYIGDTWAFNNLFFKEPFTLSYFIGEKGTNGTSANGNASAGGGGGGGTSIIIFDSKAENWDKDAVYCYGGNGGRGTKNNDIGEYGDTGRAKGGGYNDTGNGAKGPDGNVAAWPLTGTQGSGGAGGIGWSKSNVEGKDCEWKMNSTSARANTVSDGSLYIKFVEEFIE
jgi:hypothetical protein